MSIICLRLLNMSKFRQQYMGGGGRTGATSPGAGTCDAGLGPKEIKRRLPATMTHRLPYINIRTLHGAAFDQRNIDEFLGSQ